METFFTIILVLLICISVIFTIAGVIALTMSVSAFIDLIKLFKNDKNNK